MEFMFNRRRRMLTYLRKADFESYSYVIHKLGLKDVYAEIVSAGSKGMDRTPPPAAVAMD